MTTSGTPFADPGQQRWWLHALICEIGDCQLLGTEHLVLSQPERTRRGAAYWAVHVREGAHGTVMLDRLNAVVALEAPLAPVVGRWSLSVYLDKRSNLLQREALESLFIGRAGSPFDRLAALAGPRMGTQVVPLDWMDTGRRISLSSPRLLELVVESPDRGVIPAGTEAPRARRGALWHGQGCARFFGGTPDRGITQGPSRLGSVFWHGVVGSRAPGSAEEAAGAVPALPNADGPAQSRETPDS